MKKSRKNTQASGQPTEDLGVNAPPEQAWDASLAPLRALDEVPARQPAQIEAAKKAFLLEARKIQPPVSREQETRLMGWTKIFKKESSPMFTLARIVLLAAFALGGTGVTAYAAQESLPEQALYPLKTWMEDLRLGLTNDPQADFELLFKFVEERISEIEILVQKGEPVPDRVATRLNLQLQQMARVAADLEDPALLQAMEQVRMRSQVQVQRLEKLRQNAPQDSPALGQATQAMHNMRNMAEGALEDPITFRQRHGVNRPEDAPSIPDNDTPNGNGDGPLNGQGQGPGGRNK